MFGFIESKKVRTYLEMQDESWDLVHEYAMVSVFGSNNLLQRLPKNLIRKSAKATIILFWAAGRLYVALVSILILEL